MSVQSEISDSKPKGKISYVILHPPESSYSLTDGLRSQGDETAHHVCSKRKKKTFNNSFKWLLKVNVNTWPRGPEQKWQSAFRTFCSLRFHLESARCLFSRFYFEKICFSVLVWQLVCVCVCVRESALYTTGLRWYSRFGGCVFCPRETRADQEALQHVMALRASRSTDHSLKRAGPAPAAPVRTLASTASANAYNLTFYTHTHTHTHTQQPLQCTLNPFCLPFYLSLCTSACLYSTSASCLSSSPRSVFLRFLSVCVCL